MRGTRPTAVPAMTVSSRVKRTVLDEHRRYGTASLVETGFDYDALCVARGICLKLAHIRHKKDGFEKIGDTLARYGGDGDADHVAAPIPRGRGRIW